MTEEPEQVKFGLSIAQRLPSAEDVFRKPHVKTLGGDILEEKTNSQSPNQIKPLGNACPGAPWGKKGAEENGPLDPTTISSRRVGESIP